MPHTHFGREASSIFPRSTSERIDFVVVGSGDDAGSDRRARRRAGEAARPVMAGASVAGVIAAAAAETDMTDPGLARQGSHTACTISRLAQRCVACGGASAALLFMRATKSNTRKGMKRSMLDNTRADGQ